MSEKQSKEKSKDGGASGSGNGSGASRSGSSYRKFYKRMKSRSSMALQHVHDAFSSKQTWNVNPIKL